MKDRIFQNRIFTAFLLGIVVSICSCKKDEPDTEATASVDNTICEGEFSRIFTLVNSIAVGDSGVRKRNYLPVPDTISGCPIYYTDSLDVADGFPITMWINFGYDYDGDGVFETPMVCTNDNKSRKGTIKAVAMSPWGQSPAQLIIDLDTLGYWVDGAKYSGVISVTKKSSTSFTQTVTNGQCKTSQWSILWNSTRTVTAIVGDTTNLYDDISTISGLANGTDRKGNTFSVEITTPLVKKMACPYIVSGIETIKLEGKKDRTIDYGDGTCNDKARLIIDGNEFEFNLR